MHLSYKNQNISIIYIYILLQDHQCWNEPALDLLEQNEDLSKGMAKNLEVTIIKGLYTFMAGYM